MPDDTITPREPLRADRGVVTAVRAEFARRDRRMTTPPTRPDARVRHNPRRSRYEVTVSGGVRAGVTLYHRHERRIAFLQTEIEPGYEGAGLADRLVRAALDDARDRGLEVVPLGPVIAAYIRTHADAHLELVVPAMRDALVEDGRAC